MHFLSPMKVMFCFALVILTLSQANGNNIRIFRGERDRFTNIAGCTQANAQCFDQECSYCQCGVKETFVRTRGQNGECVSNEVFVYATSHNASFIVKSDEHELCLYRVFTNNRAFIYAGPCKTYDLDYRWLWTNTGQLVNMATLECATDGDYNTRGLHYVVLKKCDRNNKKQVWACVGVGKYIQQSVTRRYMRYGQQYNYVTTSRFTSIKSKWRRYGTNSESVCSKAVGCERFMDGSSIVNLDRTKCTRHSECTGQKKFNLTKARCSVLQSKTQYLHNKTWTPLSMKDGSFVISSSVHNQVFLKWNISRTPMYWDGLLVKVRFECENRGETTEHCIVIKYMSRNVNDDTYGRSAIEVNQNTQTKTTISTDVNREEVKRTTYPPHSTDTTPTSEHNANESSTDDETVSPSPPNPTYSRVPDESNIDTKTIIIISVSIVVLLGIIGVTLLIVWRRKHRFARPKKREISEIAAEIPPFLVSELAERSQISSSNDDSRPSRESRVYETPTPKERQYSYQYIYANDRTSNAPPPLDHTYDYASVGRGYEPLNPALGTVSVNEGYQPLRKGPGMSKDRVADGDNEPRRNLSKNEEEASVDEGYEPLKRSQGRAQDSADDGYQPLRKGHKESAEHDLVEAGYESLNNERRIQEQSLLDQSYQPLSRNRRGPEETDEQEELSAYVIPPSDL